MKVATLQKILTRVNGFQILFCNDRYLYNPHYQRKYLIANIYILLSIFFQLIAKRTDKQPIAVNLHQYVRLKNQQRRLILYESDIIIINNISCTPLIVLDCYRFSCSDKLFRTGSCRIQSCHFLQSYGFQPFTERNRGNHCKGL